MNGGRLGSTLNWNFALSACAFCNQPEPLQESHVIPRFVYDWLKRTSATGHIRMSSNVNLRVQDGFKPRLLCWSCEQRFNTWETPVAAQVFVPIHEGATRLRYDSSLLKFSVSVSWRVLTVHLLAGAPSCVSETPDGPFTALYGSAIGRAVPPPPVSGR